MHESLLKSEGGGIFFKKRIKLTLSDINYLFMLGFEPTF